MKSIRLFILLAAVFTSQISFGQVVTDELRTRIGDLLTEISREEISVGKIRIDSVAINGKELQLFANMNCSYIPFRDENVKTIYAKVRNLLPAELSGYQLQIITDNHLIEDLIPLVFRDRKDKRYKKAETFRYKTENPLITRLSSPVKPQNGLLNRHIALWQSHGFYYEPKLTRWEWQRARVFQTVEDLYTQSYVLPYLVPMLENAGANVLMPRERDTQLHEVVIDNDGSRNNSVYTEITGEKRWTNGLGEGFAHLRDRYINFENPFREGTYRMVETIKKGEFSTAEWIPEIPEKGRYAVYISYKTLPNSTEEALYTVHHLGGTTEFSINQQMGGGTWIYLGHFDFSAGKNSTGKVTLSNKSNKAGKLVTADAVKIGGGYGNIARRIAEDGIATDNVKSSDSQPQGRINELPKIDYPFETSGYPRFTEAARYWLQWAGIPDSIYSESQGKNDYTDDYKSRGIWVNYLAGGTPANPEEAGLNIPVDLSFAFHTDAGTTMNDSIIGTLGIFHTRVNDERYENGISRYAARDLTDLIQSNIVNDIRTLHEPDWTRRGMWNQSYYEARVPKVPAMLLELLSHQNFADMRYGLDPRFRFTVSRAIYKGMLQFVCSQYKQEYVVQPLPVDHMSLKFVGENEIELSWQPVDDPLEPTAKADKYIVYTRIGNNGFDNGRLVDKNVFRTNIQPGQIISFKVTAANEGGESFPSEILSAAKAFNEKGTVLIVNGFNRISAPADFVSDGIAGFLDNLDHGVPDKEDISFIGSMKEFRRSIPWMDDDSSGFGDSYSNYETMVIAGNTFDYPSVHGQSILKTGYSFVSCSNEAIEKNTVSLKDYKYVDLILGKQKQTKIGRGGVHPLEFKTFTPEMQKAITEYCQSGGNIFISGSYVASDLWDNTQVAEEDKEFARNVLKYRWLTRQAATNGKVKAVVSLYSEFKGNYSYYNELNKESYVVESPDGLLPVGENAYTILRYSENNISAGIAYKGNYRTCIIGFPFESIESVADRDQLMESILTFFENN